MIGRFAVLRSTLVAVVLCLFSAPAVQADVLVDENFDYDTGPIAEQEGGTGWFDAWTVADSLDDTDFKLEVVELERPLVYALPDGGFVNGGNRALRFSNDSESEVLANETMALSRGLDDIIDADEVFFSFLYRYDGDGTETGGFIDDNDFVVWWFNGPGGPQLGLKGNFGNGSAPDDFVGRVSGAFAPPQQAYAPGFDISEEAGTLNDDWLLVGKMSKQNHSDEESDYDQFDLWINPGLGDADSPHATGTGVATDVLAFELETIGMRIFNEEPGDAMIWDALRIGETFEDVLSPLGDQDISVEPSAPLLGDCNGNGMLDPEDFQCLCATGTIDDAIAALGSVAGDLDGDGSVGFSDFLVMSANFGANVEGYHQGDLDCSGDVTFADFLVLSANFGESGGTAASVPEPASHGMLLLAMLLGGALRRRGCR